MQGVCVSISQIWVDPVSAVMRVAILGDQLGNIGCGANLDTASTLRWHLHTACSDARARRPQAHYEVKETQNGYHNPYDFGTPTQELGLGLLPCTKIGPSTMTGRKEQGARQTAWSLVVQERAASFASRHVSTRPKLVRKGHAILARNQLTGLKDSISMVEKHGINSAQAWVEAPK